MATYVNPGLDASGNGNNWQTNNINYTTVGTTYDVMTDVPTLTSATAANYCTINPLIPNLQTITDGNLKVAYAVGAGSALGSIAMTTGKWYWEVTALTSSIGQAGIGVFNSLANTTSWLGAGTNSWAYWNGGQKYTNASGTSYGSTWGAGDVIGIAVDADAGSITFYKNNVSQGVAYTGLTGPFYPAHCAFSSGESMAVNFGQQGFKYTPPTGFVALNTFNLPTPTIGATASTQANKYFDATLFTSAGTTDVNVVNAGGFAPDLVWFKDRPTAGTWHTLVDRVRGNNLTLSSNQTDQEYNILNNGYTGRKFVLNSNGFTVNDAYNAPSPDSIVGWQWRAAGSTVSNTAGSITSTVSANTTAGFSIVTYTGTGSAATIGHGLGVAPSLILTKTRSTANDWYVYNASLGNTRNIYLNTTAASSTSNLWWNATTPTSTVFSVGDQTGNNGSGISLVAYCFAPVAGYSAFGSYVGNGSADGPFIYTGFRPRYVVIKSAIGGTGNWGCFDTARDTYNIMSGRLELESSGAENTGTPSIDFTSNGFKIRTNNGTFNLSSSVTYIYFAFAESPFKYANAR